MNVLAGVVTTFATPGIAALVLAVRRAERTDLALKQLPVQERALEEHKAEDRKVHGELLEEVRRGFESVRGDIREVRTDVSWLKREQGGR